MRAALTRAPGTIEVVEVPDPPSPQRGEVILGSMAVGVCGSDYHFLSGHLTEAAGGGDSAFPKVQGHEVAGTIEAVNDLENLGSVQKLMTMLRAAPRQTERAKLAAAHG